MMQKLFLAIFTAILLFSALPTHAQSAYEVRNIIFPVIGRVTYWDDFLAPRDGGARQHMGNDLMGRKMLPLVAAVSGTVRVTYPEADYGYSISIEDADGYHYEYIHVNNDTPGTDNGKGGGANAYAVDVDDGNEVVAGQLLGWMGDSGNAETTQAHLHFEIRRPNRDRISPYGSLKAAKKITSPVPRGKLSKEILPFDQFAGGSFIAMGNADTDPDAEIAVGAGPGGGPHVKVLNQDGSEVANFFPYAKTFRGGVDVAMADVDGDNIAEVITAPHSRGGPHIKIYKVDGTMVGEFMAYAKGFNGGVNLTAADLDNDGKSEIITAPAAGGGPHVRAFKPDGTEVLWFFAYDQNFKAGIDIAAVNQGNNVIITTSPNTGGGPHIKVFNGQGLVQSEFMAYDATHRGGVRIATSDNHVITAPLRGGSHAKAFSFTGDGFDDDFAFEEWWSGNWDIAAYKNSVYISSGPNSGRRASIRATLD